MGFFNRCLRLSLDILGLFYGRVLQNLVRTVKRNITHV